jgi:predicted alpha/beta superfamily hydrolase
MISKWEITIPELTGDETRRAYVYLPESYLYEPDTRYPVLYMFDGHNVFFDEDATYGKSWGMLEYMEETGTPLIIAAVECNHSPDNGRLSEYSPYSFEDPRFGKIKGRGKTTMDWMVNAFKPYIDSQFRTMPEREYTFIAGSSMGGLMSLYAVCAYNKYFSRCAALSPSVWVEPERLERLFRTSRMKSDTVIYMDYGADEMKNHNDMRQLFAGFTAQLMQRNIHVESRIVPHGVHSEASWERQIPFFMDALFYDL